MIAAFPSPRNEHGSVLLIVLWTAALLTILVTAMASQVRLSARTAFNNQLAADDLAQSMTALHAAEMELMLELLPPPIDLQAETDSEGALLNRRHRFDGRPLRLSYPSPDDWVVRIVNHAGKINLNRIPRANMQLLIEKRLRDLHGEDPDPDEVQDLLAAWTDWTDLNDIEGINGAESAYYEELEPGFLPRNNPELDSVDELLLIRGFDELFADINLEAAFTIYGGHRQLNLNLATREAMALLPGLDDELVGDLLTARQLSPFENRGEIGEVVPFENLTEVSPWLSNETSNFYTIYVYRRPQADEDPETLEANAGSVRGGRTSRTAADFNPESYPLAVPLMNESRADQTPIVANELDSERLAELNAQAQASDPWEIAPGVGRQGLAEIVEVANADAPPRVYQLLPYALLPAY